MNLNLRGIDAKVMARHKANAAMLRLTLKEYVVGAMEYAAGRIEEFKKLVGNMPDPAEILEKVPTLKADNRERIAEEIAASAIMSALERGHDVKNCRVYHCGRCEGLGVKDANRGLKE
jgi:hypothetical protein